MTKRNLSVQESSLAIRINYIVANELYPVDLKLSTLMDF